MPYTVETKFISPTNYRGSRVRARMLNADMKLVSKLVSWDSSTDAPANHERAANALLAQVREDTIRRYPTSFGPLASEYKIALIAKGDHPSERTGYVFIYGVV